MRKKANIQMKKTDTAADYVKRELERVKQLGGVRRAVAGDIRMDGVYHLSYADSTPNSSKELATARIIYDYIIVHNAMLSNEKYFISWYGIDKSPVGIGMFRNPNIK